MAMSKIKRVQKAIEIQGYITVRVDGAPMQARRVTVVDGAWVTDIPTSDLCGHVRIVKTRDAIVAQADDIIARADEITAKRAADIARGARSMTN